MFQTLLFPFGKANLFNWHFCPKWYKIVRKLQNIQFLLICVAESLQDTVQYLLSQGEASMTMTDGGVILRGRQFWGLLMYAEQLHNFTTLIYMHSRTYFNALSSICSFAVNLLPHCTVPKCIISLKFLRPLVRRSWIGNKRSAIVPPLSPSASEKEKEKTKKKQFSFQFPAGPRWSGYSAPVPLVREREGARTRPQSPCMKIAHINISALKKLHRTAQNIWLE